MSHVPDQTGRTAEQAAMLANRVAKRAKHLRKWARREGVSCYRLYDRDIPEIPVVIDWLEGHLHVAEYAGSERPESWLDTLVDAVAERLNVGADKVFRKRRERQRGQQQYQRVSADAHHIVVSEGGHQFLLNLTDYLDTGLFLDHRSTRARFAAEAAGKRVLNLFSYTASFSVYAAKAGAVSSVSVDMSNTYCDWARENFRLNDIEERQHRVIREDVLEYLGQAGDVFDLAVVDPPTFSNSKRMDGHFDVQRDHAALLAGVERLLGRAGVVYFSCNLRRFRLDAQALSSFEIEDLTAETTPEDFKGKRPHHCFRLVRR
jgi:23S rRNA G2069 N7-methylase RlmK/C1962 C5-methylase RlmI